MIRRDQLVNDIAAIRASTTMNPITHNDFADFLERLLGYLDDAVILRDWKIQEFPSQSQGPGEPDLGKRLIIQSLNFSGDGGFSEDVQVFEATTT